MMKLEILNISGVMLSCSNRDLVAKAEIELKELVRLAENGRSKERIFQSEHRLIQNPYTSKVRKKCSEKLLIEKETPYKPAKIYNSYNKFINSEYKYGDCKCDMQVFSYDNYCRHCGQKLDWQTEVKRQYQKKNENEGE